MVIKTMWLSNGIWVESTGGSLAENRAYRQWPGLTGLDRVRYSGGLTSRRTWLDTNPSCLRGALDVYC